MLRPVTQIYLQHPAALLAIECVADTADEPFYPQPKTVRITLSVWQPACSLPWVRRGGHLRSS